MKQFQPPPFLRDIERSPIRQITDRAKPGDISFGLGEPDLPTPEVIRREALRVIAEERNGYTLQAGLPALRELVAHDYPHLKLASDQVIITAGSQEAMYLALMTLVQAGDEVLIPNPGFVAYPTITRMAGGQSDLLPITAAKDFSFDLGRLQTSPQFENKSGRVHQSFESNRTDSDQTTNCVRWPRRSRRTILGRSSSVTRSTAIFITRASGRRSISEFYPRTVVISGLSKSTCMTGWRLGWILGEREMIQAAHLLHGYVTTCASTISQKAALVAWTDEAVEARRQIRHTFHERRDHLLAALRRDRISLCHARRRFLYHGGYSRLRIVAGCC